MLRREFIHKCIHAALGGVGVYSAIGNLKLIEAAVSNYSDLTDYKALVCLFMGGGNDSFNTIVPMEGSSNARAVYQGVRSSLALSNTALIPLTQVAPDGVAYGLYNAANPNINGPGTVLASGFADLFNTASANNIHGAGIPPLAIVSNVGTLVAPVGNASTTPRSAYLSGATVPPQLFSHLDQSTYWQTGRSNNIADTGWGGRIADLLNSSANPNVPLPMTLSLGGSNGLQRAATVVPFGIDPGAINQAGLLKSFDWLSGGLSSPQRLAAMNALMASGTQAAPLQRNVADTFNRAYNNYAAVNTALGTSPSIAGFPSSDLGQQLALVARLIGARKAASLNDPKRQIFFVSIGGFDTHGGQATNHPLQWSDVAQSLAAFYSALVGLNTTDDKVSQKVTVFTASDFGRTMSANNEGTDHGWSGDHFVLGDAVRGGQFYGSMLDRTPGGDNDATNAGQIIPAVSIDQYAGTLASWFGVSNADLFDTVFPNLGNFSGTTLGTNLGFMS